LQGLHHRIAGAGDTPGLDDSPADDAGAPAQGLGVTAEGAERSPAQCSGRRTDPNRARAARRLRPADLAAEARAGVAASGVAGARIGRASQTALDHLADRGALDRSSHVVAYAAFVA